MKIRKIIFIIIVFCFGIYYFYPEKKLPDDIIIDKIIVTKSLHRMEVFSGDKIVKTYKVSLGRGSWGWYEKDWDNITPSGSYVIDSKFTNSGFYKALTISYGNQVEIHGLKNHLGFIGKFQRWLDWTRGCIAVTNREVDELYSAVPIGTKIVIED